MRLTKPTFLIAELKGDVVDLVREMRTRFNPDNIDWPADIAIIGSSGVGTFRENQELDEVVQTLTPIISSLGFRDVIFKEIKRFPGTGIYYLAPERTSFDKLHQAAIDTETQFNQSPWPYNPHCTLCWKDEDQPEYRKLFSEINIPTKTEIACFSLYQPEQRGGVRVHEF